MTETPSEAETVGFLVFDVEGAGDGELIARTKYPDENYEPSEAVARYRTELKSEGKRDIIPPTFTMPISIVIVKVSPDYRLLDVVREVADGMGTTTAKLAYAWVMRHPAVTAPIVGATRVEQLSEAIDAAGLKIPDDALAKLDAAYAPREPIGMPPPPWRR